MGLLGLIVNPQYIALDCGINSALRFDEVRHVVDIFLICGDFPATGKGVVHQAGKAHEFKPGGAAPGF
jgi:hypothetical protein